MASKHRIPVLIAILMALAWTSGHAGPFDTWSYRSDIRFAGYNRSSALTNFPVAIALSSNTISGFSYGMFLSPNGGDLRFLNGAGDTELPYEVGSWDPNGTSVVWVAVDTVVDTNTTIWAFYGKAGATAPAYTTNGTVWTNGFAGVWHFNEASSPQLDSTTNDHSATVNGNPVLNVQGKVDGAVDLDGTGDYLAVPHHASLALTDNFTAEVLVKRNADGSFDGFITKSTSAANGWNLNFRDGSDKFAAYVPATSYLMVDGTATPGDFDWHHLALRLENGQVSVFFDGVVQTATGAGTINESGQAMVFGSFYSTADNHYLDGLLDEIRVSSVPRSSDWLWACWFNQMSNTVFLDYGPVAPLSGDLDVSALPPTTVLATNATLSGVVLATGGGGNPHVYFCLDTSDQGAANTGAWARVIGLGTNWGLLATFNTNVTDLLPGTSYVYRAYASNSTGTAFSSNSQSFTTIYLPAVTNRGAEDIGLWSATLLGAVTDTGGQNPAVSFEYWVEGSGTTSSVAMGERGVGALSTDLAGLEDGAQYQFQVVASNAAGRVVSDTRSFALPLSTDWTYKAKVTFAGYDRAETLTNFPVLLVLDPAHIAGLDFGDFGSVEGVDLRFANAAETYELVYEIESWDTGNVAHVWVRYPELSAGTDAVYAYWGNTNASVPPLYATNGSTWANGFGGVWHLAETGVAARVDSTETHHLGSLVGDPTGVAGRIDGAVDLDGNDYLTVPDHPSLKSTDAITVSSWVRFETMPLAESLKGILGRYTASQRSYLLTRKATSAYLAFYCSPNGAGVSIAESDSPITTQRWYHVCGRYDGARVNLFIDGVKQFVGPALSQLYPATTALELGNFSSGAFHLTGQLDEARVSPVARSDNWIWASWFNQASNGTFATYGPRESVSAAVETAVLPASGIGATMATLRGRIISTGGGGNPFVFFCLDGIDRGTGATSSWDRVVSVGNSWGDGQDFSTPVTGLLSGSNYAYRCYVSNAVGTAFSATAENLVTLTLPVVTNTGADSVGITTARLRGEVLDAGGDTPTVWFEYWPTTTLVTNIAAQGAQGGVVESTVRGLAAGTAYAYRIAASNGAGVVRSDALPFATARPLDWPYRSRIIFEGYDKAETLVNFPALARVGPASIPGFSSTPFRSADAGDLRFMDAGFVQELNYELEAIEGDGTAAAWVQVPTLATNDNSIWALWGRSGLTSPVYTEDGSTWSNAYVGIWHLNEAGSDARLDSGSNAFSALRWGDPDRIDGAIAGANELDGTDSFEVEDAAPLDLQGALSISAWVRFDIADTALRTIAAKWWASVSHRSYLLGTQPGTTRAAFYISPNGSAAAYAVSDELVESNRWYCVYGVYDGATLRLYVDGRQQASTASAAGVFASAGPFEIGASDMQRNRIAGALDEVRLASAARSSNWVWAAWMNQASNTVFATYSAPASHGSIFVIR